MAKNKEQTLEEAIQSLVSKDVEKVEGIQLNMDGSYAVHQSKTLKQLMSMVWNWWELVQTLKRSTDTYQKNRLQSKKSNNQEYSEIFVIETTLIAKHAFDKFGRAISNGLCCPICGKQVKYLGMGGYCSTECMLKDAKNKVLSYLMAPNDKYKDFQKIISDLEQILDQTTLIINAIAMIPDIIRELASFPLEYRTFVKQKITEGFCELKVLISKLMIKKNELLALMMRPIKLGCISKPVAMVFSAIQAIQNAMEIAQEAFNKAYGVVMQFINSIKIPIGPNIGLNAGSFGWLCTPRSYISPLPYTSPSMSKIIVEIPGGSGLQSVLLTKPLCPSGLQNVNFTAIEEIIQAAFPPLTPVDYYLEPELFEIRYLFSDQSDLVAQIRQQLADLLTGGPDYLPAFENLLPVKKFTNVTIGGVTKKEVWLPNVAYIWFLMGLLDGWAPRSQGLVGSMIMPFI